jgi:hypothetical protein
VEEQGGGVRAAGNDPTQRRRALVGRRVSRGGGGVRLGWPHLEERGGRVGRAWNMWAGRGEGKMGRGQRKKVIFL